MKFIGPAHFVTHPFHYLIASKPYPFLLTAFAIHRFWPTTHPIIDG